jgi:serine/threonine protein kinase
MTQPLLSKGALLNSGRYRIDDVLGQGGFGVVYLATHLELQAQVAIKATADTDPSARQAFLDEARLLSRLRHDHLPRVTDFFIEGPQPYLVMDYIAGKDLDQVLTERGGPTTEAEALAWIVQVLDALAYLHRQAPPIVHRDIKPGNIRIAAHGTVYLVDFGIAKVGDGGTHTQMASRAVSPPFSPPEQYGGALRTGAYSDVYALGATLYVLLTGALPPESVARHAGAPIPPPRQINPQISARTEQVMLIAMDMQAGARYPSAKEFLAALTLSADSPSPTGTQVVQGQPCPHCHKPPVTPNAPFCHACGGPILLPFPTLSRMLGDPAALEATCDQAWQDALKHLQSGLLLRWLDAYQQQDRIRRLQEAQSHSTGDPDAILEAFLRPNPPHDLGADRSMLDFGTCTLEARPHMALTIQRRQPGYMFGSIQAEARWLKLSTQAIRLRPHEATMVCNVSVDLTQLATNDAQQSYTSAIVVTTNRGNLRLPVQITVSNPPQPRVQPPAVQLGRIESQRRVDGSVAMINEGGGTITGTVRAEQPWLTVEAQNARFALGYYQQATVHFGVTTEQLTPRGPHRGTLVWETDQGMFVTDVQLEVTPPYAVEPGDPTTVIRQAADLLNLCDCEPRRGIDHWERGCTWVQNGRIAAALRFLAQEALAQQVEVCARLPDANIGLERVLRVLGAKPARAYKDNSGDLVKQITGLFNRKPPMVEYAILNTSKRGYLHGYVHPLAPWLRVPEPRFGCKPGEESIIKIYPDYTQRAFGDLFEPVIE